MDGGYPCNQIISATKMNDYARDFACETGFVALNLTESYS